MRDDGRKGGRPSSIRRKKEVGEYAGKNIDSRR